MLMKKILLSLIVVLISSINLSAQEVKSLSGPTTVSAKSVHSYTLYLTDTLTKDTKFIFEVSNGYFGKHNGTTYVEKEASIGENYINIDVYWADVEMVGAYLRAYEKSYPGKVVDIKNIKITKTTSPVGDTSKAIELPGELRFMISGDEVTFGYNKRPGYPFYKIEEWQYDHSLFQEVRKTDYSITLRLLDIKEPIMRQAFVTKVQHDNSGTLKWDVNRLTWSFSIHGKPYIQNKESVICSGNTSYEIISPFISNTRSKIEWNAGENMKLISNKDFYSATYSSIAPGKTKVTATVTLDGKDDDKDFHREYVIENSDVWVGPPHKSPGGTRPAILCGNLARFEANLPNLYPEGASKESTYKWNTSDRIAESTRTSISIQTQYTNSTVCASVEITNKCGTTKGEESCVSTKGNCGGTPLNPDKPGNGPIGQGGLDPGLRSAVAPEPQPTNIRIYSYPTGSIVYQKKNTVNFDIQSTNLGEGIYILEMTDQEGNVTREKVMKSKQ